MIRGDIYEVDLEPVIGSEANKIRPAVIVSNDSANEAVARNGRGVVVVVPITSNVRRIYPFQVALAGGEYAGLVKPSKAQAEQVRAIDARRLRKKIGHLSATEIDALDTALRLQLSL